MKEVKVMEKKKKTLLILGICIFTLSLIGLSYAFWVIQLEQTDENLVYTDCLELTFEEEKGIQLQNTYPIPQEELESFFASEIPYHFTITNKCESKANLSINIETLEVENPLEDKWIDVILYEGTEAYEQEVTNVLNKADENGYHKLTASDENQNKLLNDSIKAYTLHNFTINNGDTKEFSMYLFVDEETPLETEAGKKTTNTHWKGKVTINAAYKPPVSTKGMLRKIADNSANDYEGDIEGMWGYKDQITKIVFRDTLDPSENNTSELTFDESMDQDESVMSYLVENADEEGTYTAYIQGNGKIIANPDSSYLFDGFKNVKSIDNLSYLDTSQVENMSYMFGLFNPNDNSSSIETLDVSSLDTSNVTDMSDMFSYMSSLTNLTLGEQFDTSQVTDMSFMFFGMSSLTSLDLSQCNFVTNNVTNMRGMFHELANLSKLTLGENFDTSQVTDMSNMFNGMDKLQELYLGNKFNASNATDMKLMFGNMHALEILDLGNNFNPINITNMDNMFAQHDSLTTLNLGDNFDTRNVTNMDGMFRYLPKLTNLNFGNKFDTSQVTEMNGMFFNMASLTTLDLSKMNFNTSQVVDMSYMFSSMYALTELNLGNQFDTSSVTDMRYMFDNNSQLNTISYGSKFIHNENADITGMFAYCPNDLNKPTDESWSGQYWYNAS